MFHLIFRFILVVGATLLISPTLGLIWDRMMGTAPWGFFIGVFAGMFLSIFFVVRTIQGRFLELAPPSPDDMKEKV